MDEFYLLSFVFVFAACLPLWADARRRAEYGSRPRLLLASMGGFILVGMLAAIALMVFGGDGRLGYPFAFTIQILYAPIFFLLEYSVHVQRIKKNLLLEGFKRKVLILEFLFLGAALACAAGWIVYLSADEAAVEEGGSFAAIKFAVAAFAVASYLFSSAVFDLERGIIRRTSYTFYAGMLVSIAAFLCSLFPGASASLVLSLFSVLNLVFGVRVFQEYFIYRISHVNDIHVQQLEFEQSRTDLLNRVLFSTPEEDTRLIGETLGASLDQLQKCFVKSNLVFRSMMVFRRSGDLLAVDKEDFILEYCVPLVDIEHIKQMKAEVLHSQIMAQVFDLARISNSGEGDLGFAEAAVKRMLESKSQVAVESLPPSLTRLFKLIVLRPIYNQDDLRGMLVLFKTDIDYVFPKEDAILKSLTRNLSLIFTIIDSKKVQDEKNRLNREMDIAKGIQTSILPKEFAMEGYEATAQMITASEVGGDLYDFIATKYGNYIDIADVAGHGLPAGITALIHMAAIHAALRTSESLGGELEVSALYDIVNKVLVEINKDRIGSDKFMTCNILAQKGGRIDYAGSHLIGLVYRAESGKVEEIDSMQGRAAFLGISGNAVSEGSRGSLALKAGDILLLYTDGLIEARDMNERFFGLGGLKSAFEEAAKGRLDETKRSILERLHSFAEAGDRKKYDGSYADDVSLVLIRKK
jgi:sigma-B regulation protein RsbU (phosphoserine phosphatase)